MQEGVVDTVNFNECAGGLCAEPAADGAPGWGVIADYSEGRGDGDGEDQAHAAPDPAPE